MARISERPRHLFVAALLAVGLVAALAAPASALISEDRFFDRQWGLARISAPQAWNLSTGRGVLIAIVDSGVDRNHPDLDDKIVAYDDADFVDPDGKDGAQDRNGHGTHVAGIAAAETGNGTGIAGTAPGARILPVRVLDDAAAGTTQRIARGIRYAADKGADVINLSLSYVAGADRVTLITGDLSPVRRAVDYAWNKGAVIVAAAGNQSFPLCARPAAYRRVVCVGATDRNDVRAWYSNSDAAMTATYLVAPGGQGTVCEEEIFSTYLRSEGPTSCGGELGYHGTSGTSMAAPFVSGVAALLVAEGKTNAQAVACLRRGVDDLGAPGRDPVFGYGRLDAVKAVRC